jgi:hypothetical protein
MAITKQIPGCNTAVFENKPIFRRLLAIKQKYLAI